MIHKCFEEGGEARGDLPHEVDSSKGWMSNSPEVAAEEYAQTVWEGGHRFERLNVEVRCPDGELRRFTVEANHEVNFVAWPAS